MSFDAAKSILSSPMFQCTFDLQRNISYSVAECPIGVGEEVTVLDFGQETGKSTEDLVTQHY